MLDPGFVRDHLDIVRIGLQNRGLDAIRGSRSAVDARQRRRRRLIPEVEDSSASRTPRAKRSRARRRQGHDASALFAANKARGQQIKELDAELDEVEQQRMALLMTLPNLPHASVPVGTSADDNREVRASGQAARVRLRAEAALGPRAGAGHPRLRAGDPDVRRPVRRSDAGRRAPRAGA